eukprot:8292110-Alexandrium_andersonii.AAC.1
MSAGHPATSGNLRRRPQRSLWPEPWPQDASLRRPKQNVADAYHMPHAQAQRARIKPAQAAVLPGTVRPCGQLPGD